MIENLINQVIFRRFINQDHDNVEERAVPLVADTVENWDSYDTVFIGYPIWWGIAAWPVDGCSLHHSALKIAFLSARLWKYRQLQKSKA